MTLPLDQLDHGFDETAERLSRRPWPVRPLRSTWSISFEFFPPTGEDSSSRFIETASRLAAYGPEFISVTHGAGGSTRERTHQAIDQLRGTTRVPVAGHLTCVGSSVAQTQVTIDRYAAAGVNRIVALRGDPPADSAGVDDGYPDAATLVAAIRARSDGDDYDISVAAYPETHPKASSPEADLENLKRKIDAGADRAITQFFFEPDVFLRFLERARAAGITAPVVPGIMPVVNFEQIARFAKRCGAAIPAWMGDLFDGLEDAPEVHQMISATIAAEQCRVLAEHGVTEFHFYTMNRSELTAAVCRILGVLPATVPAGIGQEAS